jgi:hypothetical protein
MATTDPKPDRRAAIREVVEAACDFMDHDDAQGFARLKAAVAAYRRIPMEQTTMEAKR